ncbi:hypothetical protein [Nocardioides sp. HB32]
MILRLPDPATGASLLTCEDCADIARRALASTVLDDVRPGIGKHLHPSGYGQCAYCCWCGNQLVTPGRCFWHEYACPEDRAAETIQAAAVAKYLRSLHLLLTDEGWEHLAEEVRFGGEHGIAHIQGLLANLLGDPHFTEDLY